MSGGYASPDIRTIRAKSPRSGEYIERLVENKAQPKILTDLVRYHNYIKKPTGENIYRTNREFFAPSLVDQHSDNQLKRAFVLQNFRKEITTRRSPTLLKSRAAVIKKTIVKEVQRRLFS